MLAVLGFVTILLVLALIMSKKVSTLVALIFVPAITGFIAAFINAPNVIIQAAQAAAEKAGTAYVEPVITFGTRFTKALSMLSADYMGKGLSSIVATGVMFIFAILFFSTCSDAGVFDPIINRILKFTGEDPVYPSVDLQHKIINSHAQAAFLMVSIVFAAGAFTGVVKNSGMLASMTDALVSIIPTSMGTFIAPIVGLFSVPLSLLFDPDSYYYGVMPVIANAVSAMGGNALAVAKASIMGQMTLGFPLSPLTGATFLLLGLSGQDLGDHQKHTLPYAWVASAIMVAVGCVACGLLF